MRVIKPFSALVLLATAHYGYGFGEVDQAPVERSVQQVDQIDQLDVGQIPVAVKLWLNKPSGCSSIRSKVSQQAPDEMAFEGNQIVLEVATCIQRKKAELMYDQATDQAFLKLRFDTQYRLIWNGETKLASVSQDYILDEALGLSWDAGTLQPQTEAGASVFRLSLPEIDTDPAIQKVLSNIKLDLAVRIPGTQSLTSSSEMGFQLVDLNEKVSDMSYQAGQVSQWTKIKLNPMFGL